MCKMRLYQTWIKKNYITLYHFTLNCNQLFFCTCDFDTVLFLTILSTNWVLVSYFVSINDYSHIHTRTFGLIHPKKFWKLYLILMLIFFQPPFSKVSTTIKKSKQTFDITADSWKYLTLQVLAVIILSIFQSHLKTPYFTADSCSVVVLPL